MNIGSFLPANPAGPRTLSPMVGPAVATPATGFASPGVSSFAQGMALDGAAMMGLGGGPLNSLFPQGGAPLMGGIPPSMGGPTLTQSGFDMDRAFSLTREKIGAGKQSGDDIFAAHLAEVGTGGAE